VRQAGSPLLRRTVALWMVLVTAAWPIPSGVRSTAWDLAATPAELDSFVSERAEAAGLPGIAYAIVNKGQVVHTAAFGVAGPDGRIMTSDTVLNTASVGKTFTALAIAQLEASGALNLDAPVQRYIAFKLADADAAAQITVRHLLTHTSGLSAVDGTHPWLLNPDASSADLIARMRDLRPNRPVGGLPEYCNLNYVLLGAVVEAVSGQEFHNYLADHVYEPLGMDSTFRTAEEARANGFDVADGYRYLWGVPVADDVPIALGAEAAGMQWTTIEDMAHYAAAFADHGTVDGRSLVTAEAGDGRDYDVTWQPATWLPDDGFGHSGGWITYTAGIEVLPTRGFAVVTLANANPGQAFGSQSAFELAFDTMRVANGWPVVMDTTTVRTAYLVFDTVALLLLAAVAVRWWSSRRWFERWRMAGAGRRRRMTAGWVGVDLLLPLAAAVLIPLWATGLPLTEAWPRMVTAVPDIAMSLAVLCGGLVTLGIWKAAALREHVRSSIRSF